MGIVRTDETNRMEIEEFRRMLRSYAVLSRRKDEERNTMKEANNSVEEEEENELDLEEKLVCVTSGVSYLGIAIVNQLLIHGYSVRVIVDNQEDMDKMKEMQASGEMTGSNNAVEAVMAKLTEFENLLEAFDGCRGVFHTTAFVDPSGISGYSKTMMEIEVKASKNIIEACAFTPSVKRCVLTSSLLACIWHDNNNSMSRVIDHASWSDASVCLNRKLWYALGKLRSEKAAWELAKERGLKLATICPGLITGPGFYCRNSTSTIAYLKGAEEMWMNGVLASIDVNRLGKAHICVYEEMRKKCTSGRYICFDRIIESQDDIQKLAEKTGRDINVMIDNSINYQSRFKLSNAKISALMSKTFKCVSK